VLTGNSYRIQLLLGLQLIARASASPRQQAFLGNTKPLRIFQHGVKVSRYMHYRTTKLPVRLWARPELSDDLSISLRIDVHGHLLMSSTVVTAATIAEVAKCGNDAAGAFVFH